MAQLPEIVQYLEHVKRVNEATAEVEKDVYANNPIPEWSFEEGSADARQAVRTRRRELLQETYDRQRNGLTKAADTLKGSDNPLIKWVVEHTFEEHFAEAIPLLEALTVDGDHLAELDAAAQDLDYCNVYHQFRLRAIADGVVVEKDPARKALLRVLHHSYTTEEANRMLDAHDREVTERVVMSDELVSASE